MSNNDTNTPGSSHVTPDPSEGNSQYVGDTENVNTTPLLVGLSFLLILGLIICKFALLESFNSNSNEKIYIAYSLQLSRLKGVVNKITAQK